MITIPISVSHVSGGVGPFTFTFTSNNSNVTFSVPTGNAALSTGTYTATTDVQYANQEDINNTTISVNFTDTSTGCSKVLSPLVITNPCTLQSTITNSGEFVFVANTTGSSGSYSYEWNYNTDLFEPNDTDLTDNALSLKLKKLSTPPISSNINVTITDTNGCSLFKNYLYTFCYPTTSPISLPLVCNSVSPNPALCGVRSAKASYINYDMRSHITTCSNQTIDWSKTTFTVPTGYCVINNNGIITIYTDRNDTLATIPYRVETTSGLVATNNIVVTVPNCLERPSFNGVPTTIQLKAGDVIGTDKIIPVESRVSGTPNWATFTFTNTPTWGTVTLNGNREIVYDITNILTTPTVPDVIKWSLNDYSGNQINITDTVLRDILPVPTTVTETVCSSCGVTVGPIDLLSNDTGSIDRSTVQIVLNDPDIIITKDVNNNFTFTSLPGASLSNLNSYKVANVQGAYAPNQNFFVRTACIGNTRNPVLDLTCVPSKVFDIEDQFFPRNCFGATYIETTPSLPTYASQGGVIVGADGTVTLTGLVNKTYTFQYTCQNQAPCTPAFDDIGVLTVNHTQAPNINLSAATLVSAGVYSFTFTYSGIASNFTVLDDGVSAVFQTGVIANNGAGSFVVYAAIGSSIVISGTTVCGVITNDTTVI